MWEEFTPQRRGQSIITPIDDGDEVSFEGLDGPLCKVVTVIVGVAELVFDLVLVTERRRRSEILLSRRWWTCVMLSAWRRL